MGCVLAHGQLVAIWSEIRIRVAREPVSVTMRAGKLGNKAMAQREMELLPSNFQRSDVELEEEVHLAATPQMVVGALMQPATV